MLISDLLLLQLVVLLLAARLVELSQLTRQGQQLLLDLCSCHPIFLEGLDHLLLAELVKTG